MLKLGFAIFLALLFACNCFASPLAEEPETETRIRRDDGDDGDDGDNDVGDNDDGDDGDDGDNGDDGDDNGGDNDGNLCF